MMTDDTDLQRDSIWQTLSDCSSFPTFLILFCTSFGRAVTSGLAELCTATHDPLQVSAHNRPRLVTEQNEVTSTVPIAGLN